MSENSDENRKPVSEKLRSYGQVIVGEFEALGGVITGDPGAQAEGEFNVEVGTVRGEAEDALEKSENESAE